MVDSQPWAWVLETIADVKEADTALLKALIARAPGYLADPCYKNARERVALRYLEELPDPMPIDATAAGESTPSLGIDASKRSEDVLRRLIRKGATSSKRERHRMQLLRHDVNRFVLQKRACLPKPSLDQLKDLLLEGCHPSALSLRERSGLAKETLPQFLGNERIFPDDSNEFEAAKRPKLSTNNGEFHSTRQNSVASDPENRNILPQNVPAPDPENQDILPQNGEFQSARHNSFAPDLENRNVLPQNVPALGPENRNILPQIGEFQSARQNSVVSDPESRNILPKNILAGESGQQAFRHNLSVSENRRIDMDGDHIITNNGDIKASKPTSTSPPFDSGDKMPQEVSPESTVKTIQQNSRLNIGDGLMDAEALRFLNSRNLINHDSLSTQFSEQVFCVKCEEGGELLICNGSDCMLHVHESCLVSSSNFFDEGKFYCPFCSYIRAAAEYRKIKEKCRLARKALSNFMGKDIAQNKQASPTRVHREPSEARIPGHSNCSPEIYGGDLPTTTPGQPAKNNQNLTTDDALQRVEIPKDCNRTQRESPEARILGNLNCSPEIDGGDLISNRPRQLIKNPRANVEVPADRNSGDLACRVAGRSFTRNTHDISPIRGIRDKADLLRPPDQRDPSPLGVVAEDGGEEHSFSRSSAKRQRPSIRYKNPNYPYLRRNPLPWAREEEEILKEAVGRFLRGGQIPWALILEYGSHVFHKTRTQVDLKDKWRNLQKKQGSVRRGKR